MNLRLSSFGMRLCAALLFLGWSAPSWAVQQESDARTVVTNFNATLLSTMKEGQKLGFVGRKARLDPIIRQRFDLPLMARVVAGPYWARLTPADQAALTESFSSWAVASYAGRFSDYGGEAFTTGALKDGGRGTVQVQSEIKPKAQAPTTLTYRLKKDGQEWKIVDVYLDGTISQLASWRAEFGSVLQRQGVQGLIGRLNQLSTQFADKAGS